jgi:hypothetical protein
MPNSGLTGMLPRFSRPALEEVSTLTVGQFSGLTPLGQVPRVVTIVPLLPSVSTARFVLDLLPSLGLSEDEVGAISNRVGPHCSIVVPAPRFKTTLLLNILPALQLYSTLDLALVSDTVILLSSSVDEVQLEGETTLRCLQGQAGGVNILSCVQVSSYAVVPLLIDRRLRPNHSLRHRAYSCINRSCRSPVTSSRRLPRFILQTLPTSRCS